MKIGFIGAGAVAQSIARSAIQAGHEVVLSARRGPQALGDIVAGLGPNASADTVQEVAPVRAGHARRSMASSPVALDGLPNWSGRILVDTANPFTQLEPELVLADLGGHGRQRDRRGTRARGSRRQGVQCYPHGALRQGPEVS
jgi:8-hydroxy-5-deazaflavin:NADPH oxidoreductase